MRKTTVAVVNKKKKEDKKDDKPEKDEPPPPPPKPIEQPKPKAAPKPKAPEAAPPPPAAAAPAAAPHPALAALPNLGISMAGGPGGGGIAVPQGGGGPAAPAAAPEAAKPAGKAKDDCTEEAVKPKLSGAVPLGGIIAAAQAAGGVEGKIRLELLIDESGTVTSVRVLSGLGGAIDEAAASAGKRVKVSPSTKCGKAVAGRLVVSLRVTNPD